MRMKLRDLYMRFVALSCIPLNVVLLVVMSLYAKYKWQAPFTKSVCMWYHANMHMFYYGIGYSKKQQEHKVALENVVDSLFKERGF